MAASDSHQTGSRDLQNITSIFDAGQTSRLVRPPKVGGDAGRHETIN